MLNDAIAAAYLAITFNFLNKEWAKHISVSHNLYCMFNFTGCDGSFYFVNMRPTALFDHCLGFTQTLHVILFSSILICQLFLIILFIINSNMDGIMLMAAFKKAVSLRVPLCGEVILWWIWKCIFYNFLTLRWCLLPPIGRPGGRFKNTYELLNLRALKISKLHKNHIFQSMGKIFYVEFQRVPLKFHTKYLTHTLKDVDFIHIWKFKSSLI